MSEFFASLLTFALVSTISPGGATTLVTASGAQFGYMRSIPLMSGIAAGLASLIGAAALGLGSITQLIPHLELILRIVGSLYFLWLAWTIGRQAAPGTRTGIDANPIGFGAGFLLLWANPKGWTMAISSAGSFGRLADTPAALAALLAIVFGLSAALSLSLWCTGGVWLARSIRPDAGWRWRILNVTLAALLVASIALLWL